MSDSQKKQNLHEFLGIWDILSDTYVYLVFTKPAHQIPH